jgi:ELWxxDGT repeat protein
MIKDIFPGLEGSAPDQLTANAGVIVFSANDGTNGRELWRTTGKEFNTNLIKNIRVSTP